MKKPIHFIVVSLLAVFLAACAKDASQTAPTVDEQGTAAETAPAGSAKSAEGQELGSAKGGQAGAESRVYFALDSSSLDESSRAVVEAHASKLTADAGAS